MATKKKVVEQPKPDIKDQVKELQAKRELVSAQEQIFIDQKILEITSNS